MMPQRRLASYLAGQGDSGQSLEKAGILADDRIYPVSDLIGRDLSVLELLADWEGAGAAALTADLSEDGVPLGTCTLAPPILYPGAFFCAGANYWDHLEEMAEFVKQMTGSAPPTEKAAEPWFFLKTSAGSIIGPRADIRLPDFSRQVDWEAELGVVIGRRSRDISEADAMQAVAGYLVLNDLSARDLMRREGSPFIYDWIGQKCFTDAAPMGPWITPATDVKDPMNLAVTLSVNGEVRQQSNTSQMVHSIAEQIAYLSRHVELQPGDVIATGTPAGVGMPKGQFLRKGDLVRVEIEGLGHLENRCV